MGFEFPDTVAITVLPADATEIKPLERRVDTVLQVDTKVGDSVVVAIEVQGRRDPDKLRSWPYYIAYLHERHKLPVILLTLTQDRSTALWAQEPINVGAHFWPSMTVRPLVLGPHNVPFLTGPIGEADLLFAAVSAIVHGREPGIDGILGVLADALEQTDDTTRDDLALYIQLGLAGLPAERTWRNLMSFTREQLSKSPALREIFEESDAKAEAKGEAKGAAKTRSADILRILEVRKVALNDADRNRISGCTDVELLDRWFNAAITALSAEQVFG